MRNPIHTPGKGNTSDSQNDTHYWCAPIVFQELKPLLLKDTVQIGHGMWIIWTGSVLKAFFLESSFRGSRKYYLTNPQQTEIMANEVMVMVLENNPLSSLC